MEAPLVLLILASVILGVQCNCDLSICSYEVKTALNDPSFCNTSSIQARAVNALRNCIFDEEHLQRDCPLEVRNNTPAIAQLIQNKWDQCGLQGGRASCTGPDYFTCLGGLGSFAFVNELTKLDDLVLFCTRLKDYLKILDICKSCVGNFFGDAWTAVQADVERVWGIITSFLGGACDCATLLYLEIQKIEPQSTCKFIETISKTVTVAATECVQKLIESVQTFDWLTIASNFLKTITTYTNRSCFFIGVGGAGTVALSLSAGLVVLLTHLVRKL